MRRVSGPSVTAIVTALAVGAIVGAGVQSPAAAEDFRIGVSGVVACERAVGRYVILWTVEDKVAGKTLSVGGLPTSLTYKFTITGVEAPVPERIVVPQRRDGGSARIYLAQRVEGTSSRASLRFQMYWDGAGPEPFETTMDLPGSCHPYPEPSPRSQPPSGGSAPSPSGNPEPPPTTSVPPRDLPTVNAIPECDGTVVLHLTGSAGPELSRDLTVTAGNGAFATTVTLVGAATKTVTVPAEDATGIVVYAGTRAIGSPIVAGPIDWARPERCELPVVEQESDCGRFRVRIINRGVADVRASVDASTGSREIVVGAGATRAVVLPAGDGLVARITIDGRPRDVRYHPPARCGPFASTTGRWVMAGGGSIGLLASLCGLFVLTRRRRVARRLH